MKSLEFMCKGISCRYMHQYKLTVELIIRSLNRLKTPPFTEKCECTAPDVMREKKRESESERAPLWSDCVSFVFLCPIKKVQLL